MGKLIFNDRITMRKDFLQAQLKLDKPFSGSGTVGLKWTDSYGRLVAEEQKQVDAEEGVAEVEMPLEKAAAMLNTLEVEFKAGDYSDAAKAEFVVTPEASTLDDYHLIMYFAYPDEYQEKLKEIGINGGMIQPKDKFGLLEPDKEKIWAKHNLRYYCDQLACPYYAPYHTPSCEPKNKYLKIDRENYKADRTSKDALIRRPSFHDRQAADRAVFQIQHAVKTQMKYKPVMYTTDEAGVADLVSTWDYDFDPAAISAMRKWLLEQYGSLEAINDEWGTDFKALSEVIPYTTDEMMARGDNNLSPWADHRFFMNKTFADAVRMGADAAHEIDKDARSGIVGCQMPAAFGGYDYWLLSKAMDVIEPYNIGNNREIWRSLAPERPALTTYFRYNDFEVWRLWYQAMHGDRGLIIYNDRNNNPYIDPEGNLTERALGMKPHFKELTGGIVRQLSHGQPASSQVAIHYSQASLTAHWMLDVRPAGEAWVERNGSADRLESKFLRLRESFVKVLEDNLTSYDFVAYGQLENGEFDSMDKKVLILPQSIAMSEAEVAAVKRFVEKGGTVVADYLAAFMDGHCKQLKSASLDELFSIERASMEAEPVPGPVGLTPAAAVPEAFAWAREFVACGKLDKVSAVENIRPVNGAAALYTDSRGLPAVIVQNHGAGKTVYLNMTVTDYHRWRMKPPEGENVRKLIAAICKAAGALPVYRVTKADGSHPLGIELYPFGYGSMKILGILRNYQNRVTELGPPEYQDQSALEADMDISVELGRVYAVYETRTGKFLGRLDRVNLAVPKWEPLMITLMEQEAEELTIDAPASVCSGDLVKVNINLKTEAAGSYHTFRFEVYSPDGKEMGMHSSNVPAPFGKAQLEVAFALSDEAGKYTLIAKDIVTGLKVVKEISVS